MPAARVGNVIEFAADGDTLKDIWTTIGEIAGQSFKSMVVSASAAGTVIFETDRGADTTQFTMNVGANAPVVIDGPLNFPDGFKIGAGTATGLRVQLFT